MSAPTIERNPVLSHGDQDGDHFTHVVRKPDGYFGTAEGYILEARVNGLEVTALCGYRWVPQRDPERYPVCAICVGFAQAEIKEQQ